MHARFIIATEFFGFMGFGISKRDGRDGRREEEDLSFFLFFSHCLYLLLPFFPLLSLTHTQAYTLFLCLFFITRFVIYNTHLLPTTLPIYLATYLDGDTLSS